MNEDVNEDVCCETNENDDEDENEDVCCETNENEDEDVNEDVCCETNENEDVCCGFSENEDGDVFIVYIQNEAECYVSTEEKAKELVEEYIVELINKYNDNNYTVHIDRSFDNQVMLYVTYKFFIISHDRLVSSIRYERIPCYD